MAVDLRRSSPTFGKHVAIGLDSEWRTVACSERVRPRLLDLQPRTVVFYKVDEVYAPSHESGVHWAHPALAIELPVTASEAHLSPKDRMLPMLDRLASVFE